MNRLTRISLLPACLLAATSLFGQFETAEVLGTVHDASGAIVPKANVTLLNQDTGILAKTETDENGNYNFFNVKVGRYSITVEASGFTKFTTIGVAVNVNARQRVDATLQLAEVSESIKVTGAAPALEPDSN